MNNFAIWSFYLKKKKNHPRTQNLCKIEVLICNFKGVWKPRGDNKDGDERTARCQAGVEAARRRRREMAAALVGAAAVRNKMVGGT